MGTYIVKSTRKNSREKIHPFQAKLLHSGSNRFLSFYRLQLTIALLDIRIPALQVENPVHNARYWQTGLTRSLEFSRIRAPWSHNYEIRTDRVRHS